MTDDGEAGAPAEFRIDGGAVAGLRWPSPGAPPLVFLHATGFCASAYRKTLSGLAPRFDVLALDLRGHGRTRLPADPARLRDWKPYADDVAAVLDGAGFRRPVALAGHSCGATVALLAAQGRRDVAALALVEPVVAPDRAALLARLPLVGRAVRDHPLARGARARRALFASRAEAAESYRRKPLFAAWAEGVLDDYLADGLVDDDEAVRLACAPGWEAATFSAFANEVWTALAAAPAPVSVLAAAQGSTVGAAARRRLRRRGAVLVEAEGLGHLAPMQDPLRVADFLADAAGRAVD